MYNMKIYKWQLFAKEGLPAGREKAYHFFLKILSFLILLGFIWGDRVARMLGVDYRWQLQPGFIRYVSN